MAAGQKTSSYKVIEWIIENAKMKQMNIYSVDGNHSSAATFFCAVFSCCRRSECFRASALIGEHDVTAGEVCFEGRDSE